MGIYTAELDYIWAVQESAVHRTGVHQKGGRHKPIGLDPVRREYAIKVYHLYHQCRALNHLSLRARKQFRLWILWTDCWGLSNWVKLDGQSWCGTSQHWENTRWLAMEQENVWHNLHASRRIMPEIETNRPEIRYIECQTCKSNQDRHRRSFATKCHGAAKTSRIRGF